MFSTKRHIKTISVSVYRSISVITLAYRCIGKVALLVWKKSNSATLLAQHHILRT